MIYFSYKHNINNQLIKIPPRSGFKFPIQTLLQRYRWYPALSQAT
jgi:hypothetical protein